MHGTSKPMSVEEISKKAEDFQFNPAIALKFWLRTADTLYREVRSFHSSCRAMNI